MKTESDTILLREVAKRHHLVIIEQDTFMPLWFTLSATEESEHKYHKFMEARLFQAALPVFMVNALACVSDPFFNQQWGGNNNGNHYKSMSNRENKKYFQKNEKIFGN